MAKAISLAVHPASSTTSAVETLARMAGWNAIALERAAQRLTFSPSAQPSNVAEEAVFLLRLAVAEVAERFGPS